MSSSVSGSSAQQQAARQQRRDHREERVLRGGRDQGHPSVLHPGQQGVLLGLAEPVHLVDEQHRLPAAAVQLGAGRVDRRPDLLDPRGDRGDLDEAPLGVPAERSRRSWSCRCRVAPRAAATSAGRPRPAAAAASRRRAAAPGRPARRACAGASAPRAAPRRGRLPSSDPPGPDSARGCRRAAPDTPSHVDDRPDVAYCRGRPAPAETHLTSSAKWQADRWAARRGPDARSAAAPPWRRSPRPSSTGCGNGIRTAGSPATARRPRA